MHARAETCPCCGSNVVQPRDSEDYCEECGWPDEFREPDEIVPGWVAFLIALAFLGLAALGIYLTAPHFPPPNHENLPRKLEFPANYSPPPPPDLPDTH